MPANWETKAAYLLVHWCRPIEDAKGRLTYRDLYRDTINNLHKASPITQLPMFITSGNTWDQYIFSKQIINTTLLQQKLLNDCGYPIPGDGIRGPATNAATKKFLDDHGIEDESRLLHYLRLKTMLQHKGKIDLVVVAEDIPAVFESVFNDDSIQVQYISYDSFTGEVDKPQRKGRSAAIQDTQIDLMNTDAFIICDPEKHLKATSFSTAWAGCSTFVLHWIRK